MRYVDESFYFGEFVGEFAGEAKVLAALIARAEDLVDTLTHGRILAVGIEGLTKFQRAAVRRACCLMVDYFDNVDGLPSSDVVGYSMEGVRVWNRQRRQRPWEVAGCGMWAWHTLMSTGLMRASV